MKRLFFICIVLVVFLSILTGSCKTAETFNIVGTWTGSWKWYDLAFTYSATYTFSGNEDSGSVLMNILGITADGTYSVDDRSITINMVWNLTAGASILAHGTASETFNSISGTFTQSNANNGTWTASR